MEVFLPANLFWMATVFLSDLYLTKYDQLLIYPDIPTKLIKENSDIFGDFIFGNHNNCVSSSIFPNFLKNAIITPVHKKGAKSSKDNYKPASILSNLSKIYKRLLFKQISKYFEPILSKFQCSFRKGYNAQHCLLAMLEK